MFALSCFLQHELAAVRTADVRCRPRALRPVAADGGVDQVEGNCDDEKSGAEYQRDHMERDEEGVPHSATLWGSSWCVGRR